MRHPSRWSTGASFQPSPPTHQRQQPRRRGTVVTESTRFSIASSSNRLSCVDIDSEGFGVCEWDADDHDVVPKGDAAAAAVATAAAATASTILQAASTNQNTDSSTPTKNNKGGRELPKYQKQGTVTGGFSSKWNPPSLALAKLFPWKKRQLRSSTSSKTHTTPTTTTSSFLSSIAIIHESKLRKKVQHYAQIDDWDSIRKLLSKHPFSNVIPEKVVAISRMRRDGSISRVEKSSNKSNHNDDISPAYENGAKHGKNRYNRRLSSRLSTPGSGHPLADGSSRDDDNDDDDDIENVNDKKAGGYGGIGKTTCRRPSYESYSSGRRSFTGKESAAAAAAIQYAAMFDCESSEDSCDHDDDDDGGKQPRSYDANGGRGCDIQQQRSPTSILRYRASNTTTTTATRDGRPDIGENLLHDICRFQPPLDVLEMILLGLRDRYGGDLYTIGTDTLGWTPLHVAAACGAHWTIIDALVRLDPAPASMGDAHRRSPLHLAMKKQIDDWKESALEIKPRKQRWRSHWWAKYPHCRQDSCKDCRKISERTTEDILRIAQLLKDAMLTYPGKIDLSDEDMLGYSPLDYAIESGVSETSLIRTLIQRNFTYGKFRTLRCSDSLRLVQPTSCCAEDPTNTYSIYNDNDKEFLNALDHCEKEALIAKIQNLNPTRLKMWMEYKPFKFLISSPTLSAASSSIIANDAVRSTNPSNKAVRVDMSCRLESPCHAHHGTEVMTYEEIYNKHLQDYFDGYMHEHELGDIQHFDQDDDDGFDIFVDPEEWDYGNDPECTAMLLIATSRPLSEISIVENDDCVSVLSTR